MDIRKVLRESIYNGFQTVDIQGDGLVNVYDKTNLIENLMDIEPILRNFVNINHLHTIEEYAKHIGTTKQSLYNWIENDKLKLEIVYIGTKKFIYDERYTNQQSA